MPNQMPSSFQVLTQGFIYSGHMPLYLIQNVSIHGGIVHIDYTCDGWKKWRYLRVRQQWTYLDRKDEAVPYVVWVFLLKCQTCSILESTKMDATYGLISGRYKNIFKGFLHSHTRCDVVYWHDFSGGSFGLFLFLRYLVLMERGYTLHQSSWHPTECFNCLKL